MTPLDDCTDIEWRRYSVGQGGSEIVLVLQYGAIVTQ